MHEYLLKHGYWNYVEGENEVASEPAHKRNVPFFFGTVNHRFEYGVLYGSRMPISTFCFRSSINFGM